MIDALVILFSAGVCVLVAWRAFRLDAVEPWFGARAELQQAETRRPPEATGWRARARR